MFRYNQHLYLSNRSNFPTRTTSTWSWTPWTSAWSSAKKETALARSCRAEWGHTHWSCDAKTQGSEPDSCAQNQRKSTTKQPDSSNGRRSSDETSSHNDGGRVDPRAVVCTASQLAECVNAVECVLWVSAIENVCYCLFESIKNCSTISKDCTYPSTPISLHLSILMTIGSRVRIWIW